jgi:hypothetical protein
MNPIKSFVLGQFEKPNYVLAVLFFLLQFLVSAIITFLAGGKVFLETYAFSIGYGFVIWLLAAILMYVLLWFFKGKDVKGRFFQIFSAFSITYPISILTLAIIFGIIYFTFSGFFSAIVLGEIQSEEEMLVLLNSLATPSLGILLVSLVSGVMVLLGFVFWIYVVYQIGNAVKKTGFFSNLVFCLVFLGVFITFISLITGLLDAFI